MPPQRETFGEEEDELKRRKLKSEGGGVKARARRGEQNEERGRQRAEDRDVERMTDSGSSRERREERKSRSCPLLTYCSPLSRFFFFLFSNGSCRSRLGGNIYSYHNAAYTRRTVTGRAGEAERERGGQNCK